GSAQQSDAEADRNRVGRFERCFRLPGWTAPTFARLVHVPHPTHAHVGMQSEAVVETDDQMFAHRLNSAHSCAGQSLETFWLRAEHTLAFERGAQFRGGTKDCVAF